MGAGDRVGRIPALDGLRGVAVVLVIVGHTLGGPVTSAAVIGVTLFFVLSGFLITRVLVDEFGRTGRIDLAAFAIRRVRRLVPALLPLLAVAALLFHMNGQSVLPVVAAAGYIANVAVLHGVHLDWIGHTWSLAMEEQFYVVWPITLWPLLRWRRRLIVPALVTTAVAVTVWRGLLIIGGASDARLVVGPDVRADALVIGCLLAFVAVRGLVASRVMHVLACAALTFCCFHPGMLSAPWQLTVATIASALVLSMCVSAAPVGLFLWAPLRWLGQRSYAIYLWHGPVAYGLNAVGAPPLLNLVLTSASATIIAVGSWIFIERPILQGRSGSVRRASSDDPAHVGGMSGSPTTVG